jgi:hypothetical protein
MADDTEPAAQVTQVAPVAAEAHTPATPRRSRLPGRFLALVDPDGPVGIAGGRRAATTSRRRRLVGCAGSGG